MFSDQDIQHMQAALGMANQAMYRASPNPRVGCIIARGAQVIGQGATQIAGGPHAEVQALQDMAGQGEQASAATVYVTLEPCAHFGRTPPCVDALIAAKPARVVAAIQDPNPLVAGLGFAKLRAAGITVEVGLLETQARELNCGFFKRMSQALPWLRLKVAASIDGFTALENGQSQWITGEAARADAQHYRAKACAILTGVGTLIQDNPQLNVRLLPTPRQPLRVLVDSKLAAPLDYRFFAGGNVLVFYGHAPAANVDKFKQAGIETIALPDGQGKVDLQAMLQELANRQINEVHAEAGFKLNGSLLATGLVDEILLYQAPKFLGHGMGLARLDKLAQLQHASHWRLLETTAIGNDIRTTLRRP